MGASQRLCLQRRRDLGPTRPGRAGPASLADAESPNDEGQFSKRCRKPLPNGVIFAGSEVSMASSERRKPATLNLIGEKYLMPGPLLRRRSWRARQRGLCHVHNGDNAAITRYTLASWSSASDQPGYEIWACSAASW